MFEFAQVVVYIVTECGIVRIGRTRVFSDGGDSDPEGWTWSVSPITRR